MEKYYDNKGLFINYYEMIGASKDASTEEIIRKGNSAIMFAGDISRSNANMEKVSEKEKYQYFLAIMEAVKVLSNSETRAEYDAVYDKEMAKSSQNYESNIQSNEQLDNLLKENENLRKLNDEREEYIKELERKLSTKSNQETIDDYKEDEDITDEDIHAMIDDLMANDKDLDNSNINIKNVTIGLDSEEDKEIEQPTDDDKVESDKEEDKKDIVDIKPIFRDTEEEPQKVVETEEIDKNSKIALKAARGSSKVFVSVAAVAAIAIVILTYSANSTKRAEDKKAEAGLESDSITTSMVGTTNSDYDVEEEEVQVVEEEPYEVALDANSETVILQTISDIEQEISKVNDPIVKDMFNHETIEALVRYTRDNTVLSGETAYELFQVLYNNGIDTSMFFKNLDSYETMNKLYASTKAIDANNNTYDDEIVAYLSIDNAVDSLKADDYAAIWNVSAISDEATGISSMVMISDKEVKLEVPEKLRDVNNDGKITTEENVEGEEYWNEKNSISSDNKVKCGAIYDKVRSDQESKLRNLRWNALDNENVRSLG